MNSAGGFPLARGKTWTNISISLSIDDAQTILADIQTIAERERKSRSAIIVEAMKEYSIYHLKGNYQTLINSYEDEGEQNRASIEREIRGFFLARSSKGIEIKLNEIKTHCRNQLTNAKTASAMAERIHEWLKSQGVKVWG